ncbi:hypothetical protein [Streptomyces cylindrosporus]|uniref:Uncharacterized protein n=1 Tax=Streptomyces cylindrosporus TaxID=2927583 RepID=A0ABS9YC98_9ACTN|nr:hypothetical protein [Streptomyces cylindrosporus]MCI3274256.1 hypothetical protein [Streptomyces cylindrosporus]
MRLAVHAGTADGVTGTADTHHPVRCMVATLDPETSTPCGTDRLVRPRRRAGGHDAATRRRGTRGHRPRDDCRSGALGPVPSPARLAYDR